jgi:tetratricopeptide (TPR) repeat protein
MVSSLGLKPQQAEPGSYNQPFGWVENHKYPLLCLVLVVATLALYYPVHHYPFFELDDYVYVTGDPHVLGPLDWSTVKWAFTHSFVLNYDPLTFFSHNFDVRMFGLNAGRHHQVNVILHALNAVLLFWVLKRATGFTGRSFMVAALFAVHPIQVENVAWIAERKTILSTVFFLLALGAYRWYACRPRLRRMAVVAFLYGLGLLAKPQVITLPFVLLLWDYWPLRRMFPKAPDCSTAGAEVIPPRSFPELIKEKGLLFAIAAVDAVLTMMAQQVVGAQKWPYTLAIRLENAIVAYAQYVGKAVWPAHLVFEAAYRGDSIRWWEVLGSSVVLLTISVLVATGRRHRYLVVGWLWFLGTLVPMIGLVVQPHLEALADRYAYISFLGLFLMVCWGVADWAKYRHLPRLVLPVTSLAVLAVLSVITYRQVGYWRDSITVWAHSLQVTPRNWVAELGIGISYQQQGQLEEALPHFYRAAQDRPENPEVNLGIAVVEHQRGNLRLAIPYYRKVLAVSNDARITTQVWTNLGHAYSDLGDSDRARECYEALQPHPAPPVRAINWHGAWWRDLGPFIRARLRQWRSNDSSSP